jgi:hypothetical protein
MGERCRCDEYIYAGVGVPGVRVRAALLGVGMQCFGEGAAVMRAPAGGGRAPASGRRTRRAAPCA